MITVSEVVAKRVTSSRWYTHCPRLMFSAKAIEIFDIFTSWTVDRQERALDMSENAYHIG